MKLIFVKPYTPEIGNDTKAEGLQTSFAGNKRVKEATITQPVATAGVDFKFVHESYSFRRGKLYKRTSQKTNVVPSLLVRDHKADTRQPSTAHSCAIPSPDSPVDFPTRGRSLDGNSTADEHLHPRSAKDVAEETNEEVDAAEEKRHALQLPLITDMAVTVSESVQCEHRNIASVDENLQKGEVADKITIETVVCPSSGMPSASDSLEAENESLPTTRHSTSSSNSPIEPDVTRGDIVEVCSPPGEFSEASSIEVLPNNHGSEGLLEWEVEEIIGEETIEGETYYLVKWGTSQVHVDDSQGIAGLIEQWERRNRNTEDQAESGMIEDNDSTSPSSHNGLEDVPIIETLPSSDEDQTSFEWEVKRIIGEGIDQDGRYYRVDWKETLVCAKVMRKMSDLTGAWEERKAAIEEEEAEELGHRPKRGHGDSMTREELGRAQYKRQKRGLRGGSQCEKEK